jgi:hypothetical protein
MKSLGGSRRRPDKALRAIMLENGQIGTPQKGGSRKVAVEALGIKDFRGVLSLPTRERGLKQPNISNNISKFSRSLRGSVD